MRPQYLVQLASDAYDGSIPVAGVQVETKHNGVRASWIRGRLVASKDSGHPIGGVEHIAEACRAIERLAGGEMFLDGEFMVNGDYRKTLSHISMDQGAPEQGQFHIFDMLPRDQWEADNSTATLCDRKAALRGVIAAYHDEAGDQWEWREGSKGKPLAEPPISLVDHSYCYSDDEVRAIAQVIWDNGGEGVVIKDPDSLYRRRRSQDWRKLKQAGWSQKEWK